MLSMEFDMRLNPMTLESWPEPKIKSQMLNWFIYLFVSHCLGNCNFSYDVYYVYSAGLEQFVGRMQDFQLYQVALTNR